MQPSQRCIDLIKSFEGFSAVTYDDARGIPTIGYGYCLNTPERLRTYKDRCITATEAEQLLRQHIAANIKLDTALRRKPTQGQYDALVSLAYNIGMGNLLSSTLLRRYEASDDKAAADEFLKWNKSGGKALAGLTRRREAERALYLS